MRIDPETCRDPDLLASEVRRLQAVIDAEPLRLTDEEREAVTAAIRWCEMDAAGDVVSRYCAARAATLRGLLSRTGDCPAPDNAMDRDSGTTGSV